MMEAHHKVAAELCHPARYMKTLAMCGAWGAAESELQDRGRQKQ
jgi:hypothetical protein